MNLIKQYHKVTDYSGINWYREANAFCRQVSERYNTPLVTVCAVLSALSPGTNYEQNKADTLALISKRKRYKFTTYGQNVLKARRILKSGIPEFNPKTGAKTYNFFFNILEPDNAAFCTIDRHAYYIATGELYKGLTPKRYREVASQYIKAAAKLNIKPNELQAVLWCDYRTKQNITFNVKVPF